MLLKIRLVELAKLKAVEDASVIAGEGDIITASELGESIFQMLRLATRFRDSKDVHMVVNVVDFAEPK